MHLVSCTNTHRDVTDLVNHGMVKNAKAWISWERNIIFLRNKKILNLYFRWHILRSYRFVAEVTFNSSLPRVQPKKTWNGAIRSDTKESKVNKFIAKDKNVCKSFIWNLLTQASMEPSRWNEYCDDGESCW